MNGFSAPVIRMPPFLHLQAFPGRQGVALTMFKKSFKSNLELNFQSDELHVRMEGRQDVT